MASKVIEVERALLALTPDERAAVIERGLLSLDEADTTDQAVIDAAWLAEITRRADEHASGEAQLVDADGHFAQLRAKLAERAR